MQMNRLLKVIKKFFKYILSEDFSEQATVFKLEKEMNAERRKGK